MAAFSESWCETHVGLVRSGNEDQVRATDRILVVADGMGGHEAGEVASAIAIETVMEFREDLLRSSSNLNDMQEMFDTVFQEAGSRVEEAGAGRQMGTTLIVAVLCKNGQDAYVGHTGDSRAYLMRNGSLSQITTDHNVYNLLIERGKSPEEAAKNPHAEKLTQAIGMGFVEPDVSRVHLASGDTLLLCSDGLSSYVPESEIAEAFNGGVRGVAGQLIALALDHGGPDNVSVAVGRTVVSDRDAVVMDKRLARLHRLFLFQHLDAPSLQMVSGYLERRAYRPGTSIVTEGELGDECVILVQGTAQVSREGVDLVEVTAGQQIGELALTGPWVRSATVTAKTAVFARVLSRDSFEALSSKEPQIGVKIHMALSAHIATRLAALTDRLVNIQHAVQGESEER